MDQLGATLGHISSKDSRVTGTNPLPVYKGKLAVTRKEDKPKGEKTEKQKQMEAYLKKYGGGVCHFNTALLYTLTAPPHQPPPPSPPLTSANIIYLASSLLPPPLFVLPLGG
jgi:hypothetical protein